jgi:4-carboxymuconolactone decarboxylase
MPQKNNAARSPQSQGEEPMKNLLAAGALMALVAVTPASRAEDITRFAPLKSEQLTPPQKAWADEIAVPPRNE